MSKMKTAQNERRTKNTYILLLYMKRIGFYFLLSFLPNFIVYFTDSMQDKIRQLLKKDLDLFSLVLSLVFVIGFIYLLYLEKKHIFNIGVTDLVKIKDQVKFQVSLAAGSIAIYLFLSAVLATILANRDIVTSLLVPMFLFYKFTENIWLSFLLTIIMYIIFTLIVLVFPYIKRNRSAPAEKKD